MQGISFLTCYLWDGGQSEYQVQNRSDDIQYIHREIPLSFVQPVMDCEYSLMDCANLHKTLFQEETQAYRKTLQNQKQSFVVIGLCGQIAVCRIPNLIRLQQCCAYCQNVLQLSNTVLLPDLNSLLVMDKQNEVQLRQLDEQIKHYKVSQSSFLKECSSIFFQALLAKQERRNRQTLSSLLMDCPSMPSTDIDAEYPLTGHQRPYSQLPTDNGQSMPQSYG